MTTQYISEEPLTVPAQVVEPRPRGTSNIRVRIGGFVAAIQSILFLAHWFVYQTWTFFRVDLDPPSITQAVLALLSVSFVAASLLAFRYFNPFVRLFYRIAATWLGFFNFFFVAAGMSWFVYLGSRLLGVTVGRPIVANLLFGLAVIAGLYGLVNARRIWVKRITVKLPNMPSTWRGRAAALVSDIHLVTCTTEAKSIPIRWQHP